MRVLIDTNVVLDVLLARDPWRAEARAIWQATEDGKLESYLAATTLTNIFYLARKLPPGPAKALEAVKDCLTTFAICPVDRHVLELAMALPGSDFEDNVQLACAQAAGLGTIVTRDPAGFAGALIPVVSPAELLEQLTP